MTRPRGVSRRDLLALLGALPLAGLSASACGKPAATQPGAPKAAGELARHAARYEDLMGRHGFAEWSRYAGEADPKVDAEKEMAALREAERAAVLGATAAATELAGSIDPREAATWKRAALGLELLGDAKAVGLADKLEGIINDFSFEHEGKKITRGELRKMARGDDPVARRAQRSVYGQLQRVAAPVARELLRRRRDVAKERGLSKGFYDTLLELRGVAPERLAALLAELDAKTKAPFAHALADAQQRAKLEKVAPWDVAFLVRQLGDLPDERFPKEQAIPLARALYGALGVDLEKPKIRIDVRDFAFGGQTISLGIPLDVRAVVNPSPGARFYATLLHELGHAFAATRTRSKEPVFKGYEWVPGMTEPGCDEGIAEIFAGLLDEPAVVERFLPHIGADDRTRWLSGRARGALVSVRQSLAAIAFEREALRDPDQDLDLLERRLDREIVGLDVPDDAEPVWATSPFLATYPVYVQSYTLAAMMSHQVRRALRARFGAMWATPAAGAFLADQIAFDAARTTTDEKLVRATGSPLGVDAYVAWLVGAV